MAELRHLGNPQDLQPDVQGHTPEEWKTISKENLSKRYAFLDEHLAKHQYLHGDKFSAADIYLFVVSNWMHGFGIDMDQWPHFKAWWERIAARPKVIEAMQEEGLMK